MERLSSLLRKAGWVLLCLVNIGTLASTADAAVGRTTGSFAVAPSGAATYSIPIWAPPGPAGLQPKIALSYNSQQGNGIAGVGWNLAGLSSISRCNKTTAQDGLPAPVSLTTSDGLCLDGKRLRLTAGTYGQAGSLYQTEVADFTNVSAVGTAGNGPAYFVVKDRNGSTYFYGATSSSQVMADKTSTPLSWLLCKVLDDSGNTETISYTTATGTAVPSVISWAPTGFGASTYQYTMTFNYGTNVANPVYTGYVAGTAVQNPYLLGSITIASTGTRGTLKNYVLSYQASPVTGRSQLIQVEECADTAQSNCLYPTKMTYQSGSAGVGTAVSLMSESSPPPNVQTDYDMNGDGRKDVVWQDSSSTWWVDFGGSAGISAPVNTGITSAVALLGDVDGSGPDGFLVPSNGVWWYFKWNGARFASTSTGISVDSTGANQVALADVNGDGLPDLITTRADGYLYVRLNTSSAAGMSFSTTTTRTTPNVYQQLLTAWNTHHLDFFGSGQQDLVGLITQGANVGTYVLHFNGTTFSTSLLANDTASNVVIDVGDFNSDGCSDVLLLTEVILSGCDGGVSQSIPLPQGYFARALMDWNGDGLLDVLVGQGAGTWVVPSTGSGLGSPQSTSLPNTFYVIHNPTGDGQDGVISETLSAPYTFQTYLHNGTGQPPDLLTQVTDGYGNSVSPTYVSIAQTLNSVYFTSTNVAYPYQNYQGPLYVVNQATFSDPYGTAVNANGVEINGYQKNYYYGYGRTNLQGRGFAGFANVQEHDSRNGVWLTRIYGQQFPYAGMYQGEVATQNNSPSTTLWTTTLAPTFTTLSSTANQERYFVWASSVTRQDYELGSSWNSPTRLVRTSSTNYGYDNYGNPITSATTVTDSDTGSPYYGDSWTTTITNTPQVDTSFSNWCLTLSSQTKVTYTTTDGGAAVTRTKAFTPNTANCHYTQTVTEPGSNYQVTEQLGYDSFGNVASDSITGAGMQPRTTTVDWGTTGQFPMTLTNALGQHISQGYDFGLGVLTSQIDANGLTTHLAYDSFGRQTAVTRPDGTSTTFTLADCAPLNDCNRNQRTLLEVDQLDSTGATIRGGDINLDSLDRPHQVWSKTLNAASNTLYSMTQTNYDALGRVVGQSAPCLTANCGTLYVTSTSYDVLNRPTQVSRPTSASNSTPAITQYQYAGDSTTITDANGHAKTLVTDPRGLLRSTSDATGYSITLGYDAVGSQTSVTDSLGNPLASATYRYGVQPMAVSRLDADLGSWSYTYDALGEVTSWTDPKNQHFTVAYDALGRPTTRSEPDLYTSWTWGTNAGVHEIGRLASVCTGTGTNPTTCTAAMGYTESETYDRFGRPATRAITIPGDTTYTYAWSYDPTTGLTNGLTYPADASGYRLQLTYGYTYGLLSSITDANSQDPNSVLWTATADNERLQVTQETLGNGVVVSHSFDPVTGLLSSITAGVGGGAALQNNSYLFDAVGNLIQRQDNNAGTTENVFTDALNRLDHTVGDTNTKLSYDPTGRLASWALYGGAANVSDYTTPQSGCNYYSNSQLHAVRKSTQGANWTAFCYDPNGNLVKATDNFGDLQVHSWTSFNQPAQLTATGSSFNSSSQFFYDHTHQRWKQIASLNGAPETTEYIGGQMEKMQNATSTVYRYYVTAGNNTIVVTRVNGTTMPHYMTADHLGSTAVVTDQHGALYAHETFGALGWNTSSTADENAMASITRHEFTGQEGIDNPGLWLVNMNGRIYHPSGGTFLSPDPTAIHDPTSTISYNRYAYAAYNPLSRIDPSGYEEVHINDDGDGGDATIGGNFSDTLDGIQNQINNELSQSISPCDLQPVCDEVSVSGSRGSASITGGGGGGGGSRGTEGPCPYVGICKNLIPQPVPPLPCSAANKAGIGVQVQLRFTHLPPVPLPPLPFTLQDLPIYHTYVTVTDPVSGASYATRVGPGSRDVATAVSGPLNLTFPDYGFTTDAQTVGYLNAPYSQVTSFLDDYAAQTTAQNDTYLLVFQNSNAYSFGTLSTLGFSPPPPNSYAPGYGDSLPAPASLQCTGR